MQTNWRQSPEPVTIRRIVDSFYECLKSAARQDLLYSFLNVFHSFANHLSDLVRRQRERLFGFSHGDTVAFEGRPKCFNPSFFISLFLSKECSSVDFQNRKISESRDFCAPSRGFAFDLRHNLPHNFQLQVNSEATQDRAQPGVRKESK